MEEEIRNYIDNLNIDDIPWHRMFTAYGTAENYGKILPILEQTTDIEEWDKKFNDIYGFEHQGTLFPPAPFVLVFLVRILKKQIANSNDMWSMGDLACGLLVWVNCIVLLIMGKDVLKVYNDYQRQRKAGIKSPVFNPEKLGIRNADFWMEHNKDKFEAVETQLKAAESKS